MILSFLLSVVIFVFRFLLAMSIVYGIIRWIKVMYIDPFDDDIWKDMGSSHGTPSKF